MAVSPASAVMITSSENSNPGADADPVGWVAPALSPGQRQALLTLLADEDASIAEKARIRLLQDGAGLIPWLRAHALSNDAVLRRRVRQILVHFEAEEADAGMTAFCRQAGDDLDLEEGMIRLARTHYPELNPAAYRAVLDEWAARVADGLPDERSNDDGILAALHAVLFGEIGLRGNQDQYYDPDNSYLNRVIDRRTGTPISLSAVVLLTCRRLGLPVSGIGLPNHFICRYQSPRRQVYLDAFHGGRLLDRSDCVSLVQQMGRQFEDGFLQPVTARRMLQRMCVNLERACESTERLGEMAKVKRYQELLASA